jgi:hypothetical protein
MLCRMLGLLLFSFFANMGIYEEAGIQLFKGDQVLLVHSGRWGFPKGARNSLDADWRATAVRDIKELTGFEEGVNFVICDERTYQWGERLYWNARVIEEKGTLNESEHVQWVSPSEMKDLYIDGDVEDWWLNGMPDTCSDFGFPPR